MKFLSINTYHIDKLGDAAKATAKLNANPPEGYKILAIQYLNGYLEPLDIVDKFA